MNVCIRYISDGNTLTCDIGLELLIGILVIGLIIVVATLAVFGKWLLMRWRVTRFTRVLTAYGKLESSVLEWFIRDFRIANGIYSQKLWGRMSGYHVPENVIRRAHGMKPVDEE